MTEVKVGRSIIRSFDKRGEVRQQFPSLSLVVTPSPARYLLSPQVAYEFLVGLRGSDLYARRWNLSLTNPEITSHANFVLALVSLLEEPVKIRIRLSAIHITVKGISVNLTSEFNSTKQIQQQVSVLSQHNKYDPAYLEGYTPYSFLGHWIGDKYCKLYKRKNILEIGYVMKPSDRSYVDSFINKYTSVLGGKGSDFRYNEGKCTLMIRGETRIHLLRMIFNFYDQLELLRTTAVKKVFVYIQYLVRYRYAGINIKPLPKDVIRRILRIESKKYGKDAVIDVHLKVPSREEANIMSLSLRSLGYNVFVHGFKLRLYNYRTMLILKEQIGIRGST